MRDFTKLRVWRGAHALTVVLYKRVESFPKSDRIALGGQLRMAAVSIGANIAEGAGRPSGQDYARFLSIALASTNELESHLAIARDVDLVDASEHECHRSELDEIRRMRLALRARVKTGHDLAGP